MSLLHAGAHFFAGGSGGAASFGGRLGGGSVVGGTVSSVSGVASVGTSSEEPAQAAATQASRRAVTANADFDKVRYFTAGTVCQGRPEKSHPWAEKAVRLGQLS